MPTNLPTIIYCPTLGFSIPHILGPQTSHVVEVVEVTNQDLRQGSTVNRSREMLKDTTDTPAIYKNDECVILMVKKSLLQGNDLPYRVEIIMGFPPLSQQYSHHQDLYVYIYIYISTLLPFPSHCLSMMIFPNTPCADPFPLAVRTQGTPTSHQSRDDVHRARSGPENLGKHIVATCEVSHSKSYYTYVIVNVLCIDHIIS